MVVTSSGASSVKKQEYFTRLIQLVSNFKRIIIVEADNVGSRQMAQIRCALRGKAIILMGKNTVIRTCLDGLVEKMPELSALIPLIKENIGLVFCIQDIADIRKIILDFKVPAPARQGTIAPNDVVIPPGPTGMDPGSTSFFQALQIPTKIVKGQIEIQNSVHLVKMGEKVNASQAVLLQKLSIMPFSYGLKTSTIYENGVTYPASVLDIEPESLVAQMKSSLQLVAALSLGAGVPTKASAPHLLINALKMSIALALAADVKTEQTDIMKSAIANAPAAAGVAATSGGQAEKKEDVKAAQEEEEEDDEEGMFDLFG